MQENVGPFSNSGVSHPKAVRLGGGGRCTTVKLCVAKAPVERYHIGDIQRPRRPKNGRTGMKAILAINKRMNY